MDKATGVDELVPRFLAALSDEISVPLSIIYNRSMRKGEVPNDWSDANVSPIFYSTTQCLHCKRSTSYGNSIRLSVCHTLVLCQNDGR